MFAVLAVKGTHAAVSARVRTCACLPVCVHVGGACAAVVLAVQMR